MTHRQLQAEPAVDFRWFVELDFHKNRGSGRRAGDRYPRYAWVEAATGTSYSGRSVAATKSITL